MGSVVSSGGRSSPLGFNERLSVASGSNGSAAGDASPLSPQQLGVMGMEALETSINYWEDALAAFTVNARGGGAGTLALTSPEEAEFCREIQDLLQNAYLLQERCELLFLDQRSVLFRSESGAPEGSLGRARLLSHSTHRTASDHTRKEHHSSAESFASAEDQVADLRDFDDLTELLPEIDNLELYQMALKQLDSGIPYRTLRTDILHCSSDSEFLCKLHCLRLAFREVFREAGAWAWFIDAGRQVLTDLLLYADKEPKEFLVAYEEMVTWTTDAANWTIIENELTSKGVKVLTFYDVVLDFILLDAFEDLASPPASVLAVVRNRWLSDGFKETALTTAVWSVIKAKRRYLQYPDGFMAHFYSISEHLLPVLVWGFLGPHERLREVSEAFQSEVVGFIKDLFSFEKSRYTSIEDLAADVMQHARIRAANITDKLSDRS
ncbi:mitoguardin isoform X2 [Leptidea sinapis]|nr:mitoguardin isoform X2 [Leptidea sinapis]